ncbi:hypothetical protein CCACVL1_19189 [Corchorus capsularis]|uniref:F-box domain-containing protein n=1 Tax=Corchorus capsularis TaxID=210143 RepID=A0A1R3HHY0_COCAP|nr:hypothetical protein CCACVL1_19189 [Corchorus capsularis]
MKRSPTPSSAAKAIANNKNFPLEILLKVPAAAAEAIASDEDLLREILLRLPAKHLIRSKCVSKQWLSLISSSEFCRSHVRRHNTSLKAAALFFECGPYHVQPAGFHMVPLNNQCSKALPLDFASEVRIKQSCNGLFLCRSFHNADDCFIYFVSNPTTKKLRKISFSLENRLYAVNLAYDPLKAVHYKVIAIRRSVGVAREFEICIYSSQTNG